MNALNDLSTEALLAMVQAQAATGAQSNLPDVGRIADPEDYDALFSTPLGQQVLRDMLWRFCLSAHFMPGSSRSEDAVFAAGVKAVVLDILSQMMTAESNAVMEAAKTQRNNGDVNV